MTYLRSTLLSVEDRGRVLVEAFFAQWYKEGERQDGSGTK